MTNFYFLLTLFFFWACSSPGKKSEPDRESISRIGVFESMKKRHFANGKVKSAVETNNGKEFGNRFEFYESGGIKQYSFQIDSANASYVIDFDSAGNVVDRFGDPLVYRLFSADRSPDSIYVKYIVSDFNLLTPAKMWLSNNGVSFDSVQFEKNNDNPFTKTYEYWENITGKNRFLLIGKIKAVSKMDTLIFLDTLDMSRRVK